MEMFGHNIGGRAGGQNGNNNNANLGWDIWEMNHGNSHSNANSNDILYMTAATASVTIAEPPSAIFNHALMHSNNDNAVQAVQHQQQHFYGGDHHQSRLPDPHLMCLKLGKRHYFEDAAPPPPPPPPQLLDHHRHMAGFPMAMKRGKSLYGGGGSSSSSTMKVPRCQVEGCQVALVSAKEYHRRHKVCEMHSKASKVVVLGLEQRFCQQCSRFHVVSEFDESKRSCRRRLAGHNERRRKCSHDSLARASSQEKRLLMAAAGRFPCLSSSSSTGRSALSLLSSSKSSNDSWVLSPSDLSSRSRAALCELIAENRAAILARQVVSSSDRSNSNWEDSSHYNNHSTQDCGDYPSQSWPSTSVESYHRHQQQQQQMFAADQHSWDRFHQSGAHLTLDLMQQPTSPAYETMLPARDTSTKADDNECDLWKWNSFHGASVV